MQTLHEHHLDTRLERIIEQLWQLQELDLSDEEGLERALDLSQAALGGLALYRRMLQEADQSVAVPVRQAA